jgi:hypothetical protein
MKEYFSQVFVVLLLIELPKIIITHSPATYLR